jgi:hypothetical protein
MREERNKPDTRGDTPPCPSSGFEAEVVQELERLVSVLPPGVARLRLGRVPEHPDWPEPYFEVTPTNSKAARLGGIAVVDDLTLIVGEAEREFVGFARGGTIVRGASWNEELGWIWQAVVAGGFTESVYRDSRGKAIGSTTRLLVNGNDLIIRNGRRAETLFGRKKVERIIYEGYV